MTHNLRDDFPMLFEHPELIYVDSAATSLTPTVVIDRLNDVYRRYNANVHRSMHSLGGQVTQLYESSRQKLQQFLHAKKSQEIIFTRGTTEGLNWLARSLVQPQLEPGDIILTTRLEHHANLVPWQEICRQTGAELVYLPLLEDYTIDLEALQSMDPTSIRAIAIQHVSNVLGIVQPLAAIGAWAQAHDILFIVDGAQGAPHYSIDVQELQVDAYTFSGHKMFGPYGIGVVYLNESLHSQTRPNLYGGEMIQLVNDYTSTYAQSPMKFEGGTPPIAEAIALESAVDYLMAHHEDDHSQQLAQQLAQGLVDMGGIQLFQPVEAITRSGIVSFNIEGVHPHDAATAYDEQQIALRAGHHCCQVLMRYLQVPATLRMSLSLYNTPEEVDQLLATTQAIKEYFNG